MCIRDSGDGVAQVMEPDMLRTDGFQNFVMGSPESVRVIPVSYTHLLEVLTTAETVALLEAEVSFTPGKFFTPV